MDIWAMGCVIAELVHSRLPVCSRQISRESMMNNMISQLHVPEDEAGLSQVWTQLGNKHPAYHYLLENITKLHHFCPPTCARRFIVSPGASRQLSDRPCIYYVTVDVQY